MRFFRNLTVKRKLAMMLMMPILALLFFVVTQILEKVHSLKELHALQGLTSLAVKIDILTHEMQKERALSSGFIGSQGERFGTKLFEQRFRTNEKVEELKSSIKEFTGKGFGPEFQQALNLAMDQLDLIDLYRDKVDAVPLWVYEVIDHYLYKPVDLEKLMSLIRVWLYTTV